MSVCVCLCVRVFAYGYYCTHTETTYEYNNYRMTRKRIKLWLILLALYIQPTRNLFQTHTVIYYPPQLRARIFVHVYVCVPNFYIGLLVCLFVYICLFVCCLCVCRKIHFRNNNIYLRKSTVAAVSVSVTVTETVYGL